MKKYIAPEIEMINFSTEDVVTVSIPSPTQIQGKGSYTFENGTYGEF